MTRSVRLWRYLWLDEQGWAEPGLELQSSSYSAELHSIPRAAAGFSPRNTTVAA